MPGSSTANSLMAKCLSNAGIDPQALSTIPSSSRGGPVTDSSTITTYFMRTAKGKEVSQMTGEAASLRAMNLTAPGLSPRVYSFETNEDKSEGMMISQYFDMGSCSGSSKQRELGRRLAEMHSKPSEGAEGYTGKYGFAVPTFCGVTKQDNTWEESWSVFWRERRLGDMVRRIGDRDIARVWEDMKQKAVPLLLDNIDPPPEPVIIHGDLWSGNIGYDKTTASPVIFDPSSYWGHNEADLGITRMFGGFSKDFYDAYHEIKPRSTPYYAERQDLYELYHHLNHTLMFDGSYKGGALRMMNSLVDWAKSK